MKLNKTITKAFVALAAMAGFAACSSDDYDMVGKPNNAQVYFSNESSTTLLLAEGQNSVNVEVARIKTDGELTVGVVATDESGLFAVANNVTFAAGESTAKLPITFDFSKLESDKDYPVTLKLQGDTCAYGDNTVTVNIKYAPWSEWASWVKGNSVYTYTFYYSGTDDEQQIEYRESMLDPTQAQLKLLNWGSGIDLVLNWNKKLNLITIQPTAFATHATYGTVSVADTYTYLTEVKGKTDVDLEKYRSYFDEETGRLMLNVVYFVDAGTFGNGYEVVQLPGYTQADYSLAIADNGSYQQGVKIGQVFNMTKGADLGSIKYAVLEGTLTAEEVEEKAQSIFSGDIASTETKEDGWRVVLVDQAGDYTLIALGYDNDGAWQATEAVNFTVESPIGETWIVRATGTYTYNEAAYEGSSSGVKLYGCKENASAFALSPWAANSTLKFEVDENGDIHVLNSATGEDYQPGAPIIAGDAYDLGADDNKSYWDEEKKTLYLNVIYYVPGVGAFGAGYETFEVNDATAKMLSKARANTAKSSRTISAAPRANVSAKSMPQHKHSLKKIK